VYVAADIDTYQPQRTLRSNLLRAHPAWVILSQSQEAWGEIDAGYPAGWEQGLQASLVAGGYRVVASWPTATVLRRETVPAR
jgi:hypothetical protein